MTMPSRSNGLPLVGAFIVWFVHFMLCWVAVELWPGQWKANALAWAATVFALLALAAHARRLRGGRPPGALSGWVRRLGLGATALAGVAVVFSALPSIVLVP